MHGAVQGGVHFLEEKRGGFTMKNDGFSMTNGGFQVKNWGFTMENGGTHGGLKDV